MVEPIPMKKRPWYQHYFLEHADYLTILTMKNILDNKSIARIIKINKHHSMNYIAPILLDTTNF